MNKILLVVGGIIVGAVLIFFVFSGARQSQAPTLSTGTSPLPRSQTQSSANLDKAPSFSLKDYNGKTVSLSDFQGKPVVLNAWAAWCPFCVQELVDFATVQKEFSHQVVIIAIDRAESLEVAKKFTDEAGVTNNLVFLLDPTDSFYQAIGGFSMPETLFIDKAGNIRYYKRGAMDIEEIRQRTTNLISF